MATIYEQDAATTIAGIRTARGNAEAARMGAPLPYGSPDSAGAIQSDKHVVTSAEDTANSVAITTGLKSLNSWTIELFDTAGVAKAITGLTVTAAGGVLTIAGTGFVATDVIHWTVRGVKN